MYPATLLARVGNMARACMQPGRWLGVAIYTATRNAPTAVVTILDETDHVLALETIHLQPKAPSVTSSLSSDTIGSGETFLAATKAPPLLPAAKHATKKTQKEWKEAENILENGNVCQRDMWCLNCEEATSEVRKGGVLKAGGN
jgi:hypothetical protein